MYLQCQRGWISNVLIETRPRKNAFKSKTRPRLFESGLENRTNYEHYKTPVDLREHWKIAWNLESTPTGQMGTCSCKYVFTCTRLLSGRLGGYFVKKHDTALSQIGRRTADRQQRRVLFSFFLFVYTGIQERHRRPYGELFSLRGASLNLGHI